MINTDYWELLEEQHEHDVVLRVSRVDAEPEGCDRDSALGGKGDDSD